MHVHGIWLSDRFVIWLSACTHAVRSSTGLDVHYLLCERLVRSVNSTTETALMRHRHLATWLLAIASIPMLAIVAVVRKSVG